MKLISYIVVFSLISSQVWAKPFAFEYSKNPEKPRGEIVAPIISLFLPGADQWFEGQYAAAGLYSGYALFGLGTAVYQLNRINDLGLQFEANDTESTNSRFQRVSLGLQAYQSAGFMSAYHSFRSAVKTRQDSKNEYLFLKDNPDTLANIAWAPFNFKFLTRWTTFVPLGLLAGSLTYLVNDRSNEVPDKTYALTPRDYAFTSGTSYHAGVSEEAAFRGMVYPLLYEKLDSHFWASILSSGLFAAGHLSPTNQFPLFQFGFGLYTDYLTRRNNWSIQENIFIHFWWDVLAISAAFALKDVDKNGTHIQLLQTQF